MNSKWNTGPIKFKLTQKVHDVKSFHENYGDLFKKNNTVVIIINVKKSIWMFSFIENVFQCSQMSSE